MINEENNNTEEERCLEVLTDWDVMTNLHHPAFCPLGEVRFALHISDIHFVMPNLKTRSVRQLAHCSKAMGGLLTYEEKHHRVDLIFFVDEPIEVYCYFPYLAKVLEVELYKLDDLFMKQSKIELNIYDKHINT